MYVHNTYNGVGVLMKILKIEKNNVQKSYVNHMITYK